MAIIQISKIQQRSGDLVDLPQLSEAEFGWASDEKRLFIGKETPNENIEVLTSYSTIDFDQIEGAVGNLNISSPLEGQILAYNGTDWVNAGGAADGLITLGDAANIKIDGGAIGYVLQTDGLGNLSWTPKGTLYTNIVALSNATPIVMTVANTTPYYNDLTVTISGVNGVSNSIVNGQTFYVRLAADFATTGNVSLYTGAGETGPVNGTGLTYTNSPNAIAIGSLGSGGGSAVVGGLSTYVQYNGGAGFAGSADFTWDNTTKVLAVNGNITTGNITATSLVTGSRLVSTIASGTSPFLVTSNTVVANLNADRVDGYDTSIASAANTVVVRDANANIAGNNITGTTLTGNLTTAAQPNVTSLGTLTSLTVSGNITGANINISTGSFNGNGSGITNINGSNIATGVIPAGRLSGTYAISITGTAATASTVTTAAQPNITSVGTLTTLSVTGNVTTGGIRTNNYYLADGTPVNFSGTYGDSNVAAYLPTYTGNFTAANVTTSSYVVRSVATGISAAGTVQGDATVLAKDINVVSTVSAGQGVRLPVAVAGMVLIVNNTSATNMNVYPATGATINSLATNAAFTHIAGSSLQYYAISSTQWYTVGATYA
jgi:hypothetical protein